METKCVRTPCINCNKIIPDTEGCYLVLERNVTIISVVNEWVSPQIITEADYICDSCHELALGVIRIKREISDLEAENCIVLETDPLALMTEPPSSVKEEVESNYINNSEEVNDCIHKKEIDTSPSIESITVKVEEISCNEYTDNNESCEKQSEMGSASNSHGGSEFVPVLRRGCPVCKCSILERHTVLIFQKSPTKIQQLTTDIILAAATRKISENDRVCYKCWHIMNRKALKEAELENANVDVQSENVTEVQSVNIKEEQNENIIDVEEHIIVEQNKTSTQFEQDSDDTSCIPPKSLLNESEQDSEDADWIPPKTYVKKFDTPAKAPVIRHISDSIKLQNYKRAKNNTTRCIFDNCEMKTCHTPMQGLRLELLMKHHYYLPRYCKICSFHLVSNNWDLLKEGNNSVSTFTVEHIEDIFSLLKTNRFQVNFEDVLSIDEHLFEYWTGITKAKFLCLLNEAPEIRDVHRGPTGLMGLLIKRHRKDTDECLSNLMQIPRRSLEVKMKIVKEILDKRGEILEAFLPTKKKTKSKKQKNKD